MTHQEVEQLRTQAKPHGITMGLWASDNGYHVDYFGTDVELVEVHSWDHSKVEQAMTEFINSSALV